MSPLVNNRIILLLAVMVLILIYYFYTQRLDLNQLIQQEAITQPHNLQSVACWFEEQSSLPESECYQVQVPEDHNHPEGKKISFPLVVFRSPLQADFKVPVLHLGAGGPGAPMRLDSFEQIKMILELYDDMSLNLGRDLYIIDPRGTGLSQPLLMCQTFVDHELNRLTQNLPVVEEWTLIDRDYAECINDFKSQGVDFNFYNSEVIARDVEFLRNLINVPQWVLVGVSYSTVYAQFVVKNYPESVQALVLDSPVFPNLKKHHNYLRKIMFKYDLLFRNCGSPGPCNYPDEPHKMFQHFWKMHQFLNENPLRLTIKHPYKDEDLKVTLNGQRFLAAILEGTYGMEIFNELRQVLFNISLGKTSSIKPYLNGYLEYLLDESYGDLVIDAHYCFEDKAFIDFDQIRHLVEYLPAGYIRFVNRLAIDWPDHCEAMEIVPAEATIAEPILIDKPTLIFQGELDSITPLSDVRAQESYFTDLTVETFKLSHDILGNSECAEQLAAYFIQHQLPGDRSRLCE